MRQGGSQFLARTRKQIGQWARGHAAEGKMARTALCGGESMVAAEANHEAKEDDWDGAATYGDRIYFRAQKLIDIESKTMTITPTFEE